MSVPTRKEFEGLLSRYADGLVYGYGVPEEQRNAILAAWDALDRASFEQLDAAEEHIKILRAAEDEYGRERDALLLDKARLDWLEAHRDLSVHRDRGEVMISVEEDGEIRWSSGDTVRAAIDVASAAQPATPEATP